MLPEGLTIKEPGLVSNRRRPLKWLRQLPAASIQQDCMYSFDIVKAGKQANHLNTSSDDFGNNVLYSYNQLLVSCLAHRSVIDGKAIFDENLNPAENLLPLYNIVPVILPRYSGVGDSNIAQKRSLPSADVEESSGAQPIKKRQTSRKTTPVSTRPASAAAAIAGAFGGRRVYAGSIQPELNSHLSCEDVKSLVISPPAIDSAAVAINIVANIEKLKMDDEDYSFPTSPLSSKEAFTDSSPSPPPPSVRSRSIEIVIPVRNFRKSANADNRDSDGDIKMEEFEPPIQLKLEDFDLDNGDGYMGTQLTAEEKLLFESYDVFLDGIADEIRPPVEAIDVRPTLDYTKELRNIDRKLVANGLRSKLRYFCNSRTRRCRFGDMMGTKQAAWILTRCVFATNPCCLAAGKISLFQAASSPYFRMFLIQLEEEQRLFLFDKYLAELHRKSKALPDTVKGKHRRLRSTDAESPKARPYVPAKTRNRWEWVDFADLDPLDVVHVPFTEQEKRVVLEMVSHCLDGKKGKIDWATLANNLPGRSDTSCFRFYNDVRNEHAELAKTTSASLIAWNGSRMHRFIYFRMAQLPYFILSNTNPVISDVPTGRQTFQTLPRLLMEQRIMGVQAPQPRLTIAQKGLMNLKDAGRVEEGSGDVVDVRFGRTCTGLKLAVASCCDGSPEYNRPGNLRLCDVENHTVHQLHGHKNRKGTSELWSTVADVKFSNDGRFLFSCGHDSTAKVGIIIITLFIQLVGLVEHDWRTYRHAGS
ncbi:hypothetical protein BC936DRAFT_143936 [Jimgerdemannia flammicorona]|uniref:Myb-like domain-containing protein n=1 Tax=Jimgerdemannia flammicorona TaxID=994334 RepID=A0A433DDB1_9FUNG|nr:hypothetical protein BC936DRAFT_143936 [Jimgerdemannia flammicorona]